MTTTASLLPRPYRFSRFFGWSLLLLGWNGYVHFRPEAWLRQFGHGLVGWQLLAGVVWLIGFALLLYPRPWPAALKLLGLATLSGLLALGVYYQHRIQLAQEVIDAYQHRRPGH